MNRLMTMTGAALIGLSLTGCATTPTGTQFGEPLQSAGVPTLTVAKLCANPQPYMGKVVQVRGVMGDVCPDAGCWGEIADKPGEKGLFMSFVFDRAKQRVPVEAKGHPAVAQGKVTQVEVPEEQRKHYAEERGASAAELAKIKGPENTVRLECASINIEGVKVAEPRTCSGK
jgi:hypothetical protein